MSKSTKAVVSEVNEAVATPVLSALVQALVAGDTGLAVQSVVELKLAYKDVSVLIDTLSGFKKDLKVYYKDVKAAEDLKNAEAEKERQAAANSIIEEAKKTMLANMLAAGISPEDAQKLIGDGVQGVKTRKPRATTTIVVDGKEYVINGRMSNEVKDLIAKSGLSNEEFIKTHVKAETQESTEDSEITE